MHGFAAAFDGYTLPVQSNDSNSFGITPKITAQKDFIIAVKILVLRDICPL